MKNNETSLQTSPQAGLTNPASGAGHLIWGAILDLLFPPRCVLCDQILRRKEKYVCRECAGELPLVRQPVCGKCGRQISEAGRGRALLLCPDCARDAHPYIRGACTFRYEGALRDSVLRMKFHNRRDYLDFYAAAMVHRNERFLQQIRPATLLPVPMHPKKKRERGYDQCLLLARKLAQEMNFIFPMTDQEIREAQEAREIREAQEAREIQEVQETQKIREAPKVLTTGRNRRPPLAVSTGNLIRVRYTQPQKGLDRRERRKNLEGAFHLEDAGRIKEPVLIIDDIYTTGSTIDAITRELNCCGIREVYFLAICG